MIVLLGERVKGTWRGMHAHNGDGYQTVEVELDSRSGYQRREGRFGRGK